MLAGHPSAASLEFDLEAADTGPLEQFLDREMIVFAEHYLRVREADSIYLRHARVTDPVCGMSIRPADTVETCDHEGTHDHFCSAGCAERFRHDREGYVRQSRPSHGRV